MKTLHLLMILLQEITFLHNIPWLEIVPGTLVGTALILYVINSIKNSPPKKIHCTPEESTEFENTFKKLFIVEDFSELIDRTLIFSGTSTKEVSKSWVKITSVSLFSSGGRYLSLLSEGGYKWYYDNSNSNYIPFCYLLLETNVENGYAYFFLGEKGNDMQTNQMLILSSVMMPLKYEIIDFD